MKRILEVVGVLIVVIAYFVMLALIAQRQVYSLLLVPSLFAAGYAFAKKRVRAISAIFILIVPAIFAVAPIDARIVGGEKKKGVFILPIEYGLAPRSVDQGYCPGGCMVNRATHAIVFSI